MSDTMAKTCGNCKHADIPAPRMSKHRTPRIVERFFGRCEFPEPMQPMCLVFPSVANSRKSIWASADATKCPCWEPKGGE